MGTFRSLSKKYHCLVWVFWVFGFVWVFLSLCLCVFSLNVCCFFWLLFCFLIKWVFSKIKGGKMESFSHFLTSVFSVGDNIYPCWLLNWEGCAYSQNRKCCWYELLSFLDVQVYLIWELLHNEYKTLSSIWVTVVCRGLFYRIPLVCFSPKLMNMLFAALRKIA